MGDLGGGGRGRRVLGEDWERRDLVVWGGRDGEDQDQDQDQDMGEDGVKLLLDAVERGGSGRSSGEDSDGGIGIGIGIGIRDAVVDEAGLSFVRWK
jgi:hypothetical protein